MIVIDLSGRGGNKFKGNLVQTFIGIAGEQNPRLLAYFLIFFFILLRFNIGEGMVKTA